MNFPPKGGPELRVWNSLVAMSELEDVSISLLYRGQKQLSANTQRALESLFGEQLVSISTVSPMQPSNKTFFSLTRRIISRMPVLRAVYSLRTLLRVQERSKSEVVWFSFGNISSALIWGFRLVRPEVQIVNDTDAVWSQYLYRAGAMTPGGRGWIILLRGIFKRLEEGISLRLADATTAVSEVDRQQYLAFYPKGETKLFLFANVLETLKIPSVAVRKAIPESLLITGSFDFKNSPMAHGTQWFLNEVWPLVKAGHSSPRLIIAGRGAPDFLSGFDAENISVLGSTDDFTELFDSVAISLVPLWFESGTRLKILQSGLHELAVVSTSLGAEGLGLQHGKEVLIGDSINSFASNILLLMNNPLKAAELGQNLRKVVETKYSTRNASDQLGQVLGYLGI